MDIVLHLGGTYTRALTAARIAKFRPESKIVVSSEGAGFMPIYEAEGIAKERIIVDEAAWDTVTNFTHTYKLLKGLSCSRLFVVTDLFHSYRSGLIALACWGGRVPFYLVPHRDNIRESDEAIAWMDFARALCWRLFGILFFDKKTRQERQPNYQPSTEHARAEIGL